MPESFFRFSELGKRFTFVSNDRTGNQANQHEAAPSKLNFLSFVNGERKETDHPLKLCFSLTEVSDLIGF